MQSSATLPATDAIAASRPQRLDSTIAPAVLGGAALLAVAGDALLREGIFGIAFPILTALAAAVLVALAWRAELVVPAETKAWLGVAIVSSLGMAWRDAEMLQVLNFFGTVGGLFLAATTLNRPGSVVFAPLLTDAVLAVVRFARTAAPGIFPLVFSEAASAIDVRTTESRAVRIGRIALVVVPLLLIFGGLLRSADPIFASLTSLPAIDGERLFQHAFTIAFLCVAAGGWARAALLPKDVEPNAAFDRIRLGSLEMTAGLITLNVLFGAFVLTQLGWFFGGEAFLRARTGLTAAEYARRGFFEMMWVVMLVVPMLVASRVMLTPGRSVARRHTALALPIVGFLAVMIVSAALRMRLYVQYYGLSVDRFYPLVFMLWLGFVLVWLSATVLRGWNRPFLAGVAVSAFATLVGLNISAPDRIVARVNLSRVPVSKDSAPVDLLYLARSSGEATDLAVKAVLARPVAEVPAREHASLCLAAKRLVETWGSQSPAHIDRDIAASWRTWNAGKAKGFAAVLPNEARLRDVMSATCTAEQLKSN